MGGLGNQLFQWAYAKSLSIIYNVPYYIDKSFYLNQIGVTPRDYELHKFEFLEIEFKEKPNNINLFNIYDGNPNVKIDINKNYFLYGYFQSEKYFFDKSEYIRRDLRMTEYMRSKLYEKYGNLYNHISLHVRRTDYLTSGNGFHPVQPISYYENAIKLLSSYERLLIFSDDINWCKSNLRFDNSVFIEQSSNVEDLWLMSLCRDNIIANSSFSWWGAWLNENENKKVIAPIKWFNGQNTPILVPDSWNRI